MKRQLTELLERRKEQMIAALWANSGFEGKEGADARREAIESLEEHYDRAVETILFGPEEEEEQDDPYGFFEAGKRGVAKLEKPRNDEGSVKEVVDYSKDIDQS